MQPKWLSLCNVICVWSKISIPSWIKSLPRVIEWAGHFVYATVCHLILTTTLSVTCCHLAHEKAEPQRTWKADLGFWLSKGWRQTLRVTLLSPLRGFPKGLWHLWGRHSCICALGCDTVIASGFWKRTLWSFLSWCCSCLFPHGAWK